MVNIKITDKLRNIPGAYRDAVAEQWQALYSKNGDVSPYQIEKRGLPAPVWITRGLPDNNYQAWETLQDELQTISPQRPFCIYLHIPFCDNHCPFCDCYAFALKRNQEYHTCAYTDCLIAEMDLWARQGNLSRRPVSTVHLGGGTPTMLGQKHLERLVNALRHNFQVNPETEWAIETTSSSLDEQTFQHLHNLGFRRLHIGVQSLQDEVRNAINRREPANKVMEKISKALAMGWIASVDVVVGLPYQTPHGLLDDLNRLMEIGVEGFSVYELQQSDRNRHFVQSYSLQNTPALQRYFQFQLTFQHLLAHGYTANVFNHLAKGRDRNLYFTFPQRDEDLLAIGTIADGVFNNYHYRHPPYLPYLNGDIKGLPTLQGGLRRTAGENLLHELEVQILSGTISSPLFSHRLGKNVAEKHLEKWIENGLITPGTADGFYSLSPNGAWFAGQLLQEVRWCNDKQVL